jgi:hypothetical protein
MTLTRQNARADVAPLTGLTESGFSFSSYSYPIDIETLSHAILFNVLVQSASKDITSRKVDIVKDGTTGSPVGSRTSDQIKNNVLGLTRKTQRTSTAIALYVPETVVFDSSQNYQTPNLLDTLGIAGTAAATLGSKANPTSSAGAIGATLAATGLVGASSMATGALGGALSDFFRKTNSTTGQTSVASVARIAGSALSVSNLKTGAQIVGFAVNPVIEVLYSSPNLRTFNFDFVFAPRSTEESDAVWNIIYQFRRHSSPELIAQGTLFIPPSEFEITFLRKTPSGFKENTNIPRMATCVLTSVQVDYASSGQFSTFTDGMPVQIRMRLSLKELNIITREAVDKGY